MAWIRCMGDSGGSFVPTSNLWGGLQMAIDLDKAGLSSAAPADNYISLTGSYTMNNRTAIDGIFKENTQYTCILAYENNSAYSGGNITANLAFLYSDGTADNLTIPNSTADTKYTHAFVSAEGKTLTKIICAYVWETAKIYYNESGVFEGVKTVEDFEPYNRSSTILLTEGLISTDSGPTEAFYDKDGSSYEYLAVKVWMVQNEQTKPWAVALVPTSTIPEGGYRTYDVMLHDDGGAGVVSDLQFSISKTSIKVITYTTRLWYYCYADVTGIPNNELF